MFKLSNRQVQVDFVDKTQIIINPNIQKVFYKSKKGEYSIHMLQTALDENFPEMVKRLNYAKDLLSHVKQNKDGEIKEGIDLRLSMAPNGNLNLMSKLNFEK